MRTLGTNDIRNIIAMHIIDNALKIDNAQDAAALKPQGIPLSSASDATSRSADALAVAKAHFIARGWRPLAIHPPELEKRCEDVSALLLMNDAGDTAWLSARDWSALANPVDAFRREMACVRAAHVNETILVYDGDFPDNVVEVAAHEPSLRLIDASALRSMPPIAPSSVATASTAPTRRKRLAAPARQAAHYFAQVREIRPVAAAERYVHDKFAHGLRQLNGERRRLKTLSTALLVLLGASFGFLAFNMAVALQTPDAEPTDPATAQADPMPLPQPMPPPQGYVAQAAGSPGVAMRGAAAPYRVETAPQPARLATVASGSGATTASWVGASADTGAMRSYGDVEQTQRRADAAMQVIAGSTQEVRAPTPQSTLSPNVAAPNASTTVSAASVPLTRSLDPAMADGEAWPADPAIVD